MKRLAALLLVAGCSSPITEVVLVIDQVGINIPRDIDTIHISLGHDKLKPDSFYDFPVYLCEEFAVQDCKHLPLTATLLPGAEMPTDQVRVEVQARLHGNSDQSITRIKDVALFKFTKNESLRLQIVLTPNCLDDPLRCSEAELACDQNGCYMPQPEKPGADLGVTLDLSPPRDLAGVDFKGVDLACAPGCPPGYCGLDKNGCGVACTCDPDSFTTCGAGMMCIACGIDNMSCCPTAPRCQSSAFACDSPDITGTCVPCTAQGGSCSASGQPCCANSVCDGNTCVKCGQAAGDPCCAGSMCSGSLSCVNGHCQPCGATNQPCCMPPNTCQPNNQCVNGPAPGGPGGLDHCEHCGNPGESCCNGMCNNPSQYGCDNRGECSTCGNAAGQPCCQGSCNGLLDCQTGFCQSCGQTPGAPCCLDGDCAANLVCWGGQCFPPDMAMSGMQDMSLHHDMSGMRDMSSGLCGNHGQPCCTGGPPCNGTAWLTCIAGLCSCGVSNAFCCQDDAPPYCTAVGTSCNLGTNQCLPFDMKGMTTVCLGGAGVLGDDCCYQSIDGLCAPYFVCCHKPGGCNGLFGSVGPHQCHPPPP